VLASGRARPRSMALLDAYELFVYQRDGVLKVAIAS
jgi:hypothetical protein